MSTYTHTQHQHFPFRPLYKMLFPMTDMDDPPFLFDVCYRGDTETYTAGPSRSSDEPLANERLVFGLDSILHPLSMRLESVANGLLHPFRARLKVILSPRGLVEVGDDAVLV